MHPRATTAQAALCLACVHTVLLHEGVDAVLSQWPELGQHQVLLEQVSERETNRAGAEGPERLAAPGEGGRSGGNEGVTAETVGSSN